MIPKPAHDGPCPIYARPDCPVSREDVFTGRLVCCMKSRGSILEEMFPVLNKKDKSVLDGIQVKEHGFPLGGRDTQPGSKQADLVVTGHCPSCGAGVYGHQTLTADLTPVALYSCKCREQKPKSLVDTTHTK